MRRDLFLVLILSFLMCRPSWVRALEQVVCRSAKNSLERVAEIERVIGPVPGATLTRPVDQLASATIVTGASLVSKASTRRGDEHQDVR